MKAHTCTLVLLLVSLYILFLIKQMICIEYYVKPEDSSPTCPSQPCLTLSEYLRNVTTYFVSGSMFTLLQGQHLTGITLKGSCKENTLISMDEGGSIIIVSSEKIRICSVRIQYMGRNQTPFHTALTIVDSDMIMSNVFFAGGELYSQAIELVQSTASLENCSFTSWYGIDGGAIYADESDITFSGYTSFTNNTAENSGGGIYACSNSNINFTGTVTFMGNKAIATVTEWLDNGGIGIYSSRSSITIDGLLTFKNNSPIVETIFATGINVQQSTLRILSKAVFSENTGGILGHQSNIHIEGLLSFVNNHNTECIYLSETNFTSDRTITFVGNTQRQSSTMILVSSMASFRGKVHFINNTAYNGLGGALHAINSKIRSEGDTYFGGNSAPETKGGAIKLLQHSTLNLIGKATFQRNSAEIGGGVYVDNSVINITGYCLFQRNTALKGGGIVLEENGKVNDSILDKCKGATDTKESNLVLHSPVSLIFDHNRAQLQGGGIFIKSDICERNHNQFCFFAIEADNFSISNIHLSFEHNYASYAGAALYGGSLGYCLAQVNEDYFTNDSLQLFTSISNISSSEHANVRNFSPDPFQIELCDFTNYYTCNANTGDYFDSCHYHNNCATIHAARRETFNLSVRVVDKRGIPVKSAIQAHVQNNDRWTDLILLTDTVEAKCTNISFRLAARDKNATIILHPDGPCSSTQKKVIVILEPCPPGFKLERTRCTCEERFLQQKDIKCDTDKLKFKRLRNVWIESIWDVNQSFIGFLYHQECPTGYCIPESKVADITFSFDNKNPLCTQNRTGRLCGACRDGYSLVLNSFTCRKCENSFISLLLFFGFAGVALIVTLLALHMTVAAGTINGLILYANLVNVNGLVFFPQGKTINYLAIFISWLNLDFGIETCFYDGLDFYSYAWLEYVFPCYLWFLIAAIILTSKFSVIPGKWKLFGSNPVAVLATVILMSFAKLLQATILTLTYTNLTFWNGRKIKVWLNDANIDYFKGKHVILSIMAISVIFLLLIPYCFLIMFGYRFQACSNKKAFVWFNNFKPLLDAYYAPYRPTMRFWPGFMLLIRGSLFMVTALSSSTNVNLIAISSVFTAVLALPWLGHRIYEKLYNEILEVSFILNICLLSTATFFVKFSNGSQEIVTYFSISVALLELIGIVGFHAYLSIRHTKLVEALCRIGKRPLTASEPTADFEEWDSDRASSEDISSTVIELREPLLDSFKTT